MCDLDPKVKVIGKKAGICDGLPSTAALVKIVFLSFFEWLLKTGFTVTENTYTCTCWVKLYAHVYLGARMYAPVH